MKKTFAAFHWQELRKFGVKSSPQRWQLTMLNELLDRKLKNDNNNNSNTSKKQKRVKLNGRFIEAESKK